MAEDQPKKLESEPDSGPSMASGDASPKANESLALYVVETSPPESARKQTTNGSHDRDLALAHVQTEKRMSFVKAWEEGEIAKVENRAQKDLSAVASWENSRKAALEANLRKVEEQFERKKAEYAQRMKNKIALVHKEAEEKRAMVEAKRGEDILKAEEMSAKYRATGQVPKKPLGCLF